MSSLREEDPSTAVLRHRSGWWGTGGIFAVSVCLLACIAFVMLARDFWDYTLDDAYISFRYARNLIEGNGLVFNAGEYPRSEGITSPLWGFVLSVGIAANIDPLLWAKWLGVVGLFTAAAIVGVTVFKAISGATTLSVGASRGFAIVAAASLIVSPYMVVNSLSGMETTLAVAVYAVFLLSTMWTVELGTRRSVAVVTGVCAVAVPMLRPEMALAVAVTLVSAFVLWRPSRVNVAVSIVTFAGIGIAYFFIRYAYYGLPLPLPFYIKQGKSGFPGWADVAEFVKYAAPLGLLSAVTVCFAAYAIARKRANPAVAALLAISVGAAAQVGYYATIHHIMGFGFRYFMPVLVAFTITGTVGIGMLCARITTRTGLQAAVVAAFGAALLVPNALALSPTEKLVSWYNEGKLIDIATSMRNAGVGSFSLAMNDCGAIPYVTRSRVLDLAGLNERNIALLGTREVAVQEISRARPDLILLVASRVNDPSSVLGWENLSDEDMRSLGYQFAGTIELSPEYNYLVYANPLAGADLVLERMQVDGTMTARA
jgi:hypothetical protein